MNQLQKQIVKNDDKKLFHYDYQYETFQNDVNKLTGNISSEILNYRDYENIDTDKQIKKEYEYSHGNVTKVKTTQNLVITDHIYKYNTSNELIYEEEKTGSQSKVITYNYDNSGNKSKKEVYQYKKTLVPNEFGLLVPTYGLVLTNEILYSYDSLWKDRLTKITDKLPEYGTQIEKNIVYDEYNPSNPIFCGRIILVFIIIGKVEILLLIIGIAIAFKLTMNMGLMV